MLTCRTVVVAAALVSLSAVLSGTLTATTGAPTLIDTGSTGTTFAMSEAQHRSSRVPLTIGSTAPDFAFTDLEGKSRRLSDYRGEVVLLDFWGAWCAPCVPEAPKLVAAYEKCPDRGFEIVGIDTIDTREKVLGFISTHKMRWTQTMEAEKGPIQTLYRVSGFPSYFLIGPDGAIKVGVTGSSIDLDRELPALLVGLPLSAQAQKMKLGEVIVFTPFGTTRPIDSNAHVFQGDRGSRKGNYLLTWSGSSKDKRPPVVPGSTAEASEYHLVSPSTVGPLPDVDVLGIHYVKVRPDRHEAFEKFVGETLHPAVGNLRPDLRLLYYKAVRGPDAGKYITIFALTKESRDKYWPGGSDSDDLRAAFKPVRAHTKELLTYLVDGSALTDEKFAAAVYESREWADFVLIPAGR